MATEMEGQTAWGFRLAHVGGRDHTLLSAPASFTVCGREAGSEQNTHKNRNPKGPEPSPAPCSLSRCLGKCPPHTVETDPADMGGDRTPVSPQGAELRFHDPDHVPATLGLLDHSSREETRGGVERSRDASRP